MMNIENRRTKKIKILTLEDEESWCNCFKIIFDKRYYELYPTDRIEAAKEFLENKPIDIVIVNIKLFQFPSDKSGIILLEYMQSHYSWLPRIVYTGYTAKDVDKNKYGLRSVLTKPTEMHDASDCSMNL